MFSEHRFLGTPLGDCFCRLFLIAANIGLLELAQGCLVLENRDENERTRGNKNTNGLIDTDFEK